MSFKPSLIPSLIQAVTDTINENSEAVTALDQAIGDGDHVINLQRGIVALEQQGGELSQLVWPAALQKIGMILMSTMGGASGSLYGTLFVSMGKAAGEQPDTLQGFAEVFTQGVEAVKKRGKADIGEKTMLDVLIPVAKNLQQAGVDSLGMAETLEKVTEVASAGVESTRDLLATKGRASFLGERSKGHLDAGAKTSQLIIEAVAKVLSSAPV